MAYDGTVHITSITLIDFFPYKCRDQERSKGDSHEFMVPLNAVLVGRHNSLPSRWEMGHELSSPYQIQGKETSKI